jgi:hypothetical protein
MPIKCDCSTKRLHRAQVIQEYDAISPLDPWMTTVLLRIKRSLASDKIEL